MTLRRISPVKPVPSPKNCTSEGRGSPQNSQPPSTIQMGTAPRIMAAVPEEMDSCPLARKPLAINTMKNARTKLWERSLLVGRLRSPRAQLQRYRSMPANIMRRPHIMNGGKLSMANLMEMKQEPHEI